jgi:hypothetical protein
VPCFGCCSGLGGLDLCTNRGSFCLRLVAYVRTVRTASGRKPVHSSGRGARDSKHLGLARDKALKAAAVQRLAAGQGVLGLDAVAVSGRSLARGRSS